MGCRILFLLIATMSIVSLCASAESQRFDSELLSTRYRFAIADNALPDKWYMRGSSVDIDVQAKFSMYSLMGEPVVFCSATWQLVSLGGLNLNDIPPEILKKVELYNVHLELNFFVKDFAGDCDVGVPYPNGSTTASFNVPESPEWEQLFHNTAISLTTTAFRAKEIRWNYSELQAKELLAQIFSNPNQQASIRVLDAYIDLSPIKYYLLEQQQQQYQKIQASLPKHTQSNQEQNDADIFSQIVERAFVEKQIQQVSKKITQSRDTSTSIESAATINHEKKQRLQQQCAGFDMPTASLAQVKLSDDNLSACTAINFEPYRDEQTGLWGLKDHKGGIRVAPKYKHISEFKGNLAIAQLKSERAVEIGPKAFTYTLYGAIDHSGREVIPFTYFRLDLVDDDEHGQVYSASLKSWYEDLCIYETRVKYDLNGIILSPPTALPGKSPFSHCPGG